MRECPAERPRTQRRAPHHWAAAALSVLVSVSSEPTDGWISMVAVQIDVLGCRSMDCQLMQQRAMEEEAGVVLLTKQGVAAERLSVGRAACSELAEKVPL